MIEILESAEVRQRALPISVATWHWMVEHDMVQRRAELIRGVIIEKMSKSSLHEFLVQALYLIFAQAGLVDCLIRKEGPLTLADSEPEPDLSIVKGTNADYRDGHPQTALLVVEVAVSSESSDREMVKAYAEAGVPECWLVVAKRQEIECYTEPVAGVYAKCRVFGAGEEMQAVSLPGIVVSQDRLFA